MLILTCLVSVVLCLVGDVMLSTTRVSPEPCKLVWEGEVYTYMYMYIESVFRVDLTLGGGGKRK